MRKKGCNYFQWFDEDMRSRAKDIVRSLKDKNDELMDLIRDTEKREQLLKMKIKFMSLSLVFVLLLVFALVANKNI